MKIAEALLLKAVEITPGLRPCHASTNRRIQQDGAIGSQGALNQVFQLSHQRCTDPTASALIGVSGIGEPIAKHPLSTRKRRQYDSVQVLGPCCEHEQELSGDIHLLFPRRQQKLAY